MHLEVRGGLELRPDYLDIGERQEEDSHTHNSVGCAQFHKEDPELALAENALLGLSLASLRDTADAVGLCCVEHASIEGQARMTRVVVGVVRAEVVGTDVLLVQRVLGGARANGNRTWEEMDSCAALAYQD